MKFKKKNVLECAGLLEKAYLQNVLFLTEDRVTAN